MGLKSNGKGLTKIAELMYIPYTCCWRRYNELMAKGVDWNAELDQKLKKSYQIRREEMWKSVADDIGVPWRAAEDRAWDLGKKGFVKK